MSLTAGDRGRFLHEFSVTFGARLLGVAVTVLASVIAARFLGPEGKGAMAVISLISSLAIQFGGLGLNASTTYFTARDPGALPRIAGISLAVGMLMGTSLSLMVLAIAWLFPQSLNEVPARFLFIPIVVIPFALVSQYFQNILLGMQRIVAFNLVDLAGKGVGLVATIVIVSILGLGVWELLVAGMAISVGVSLVTVWVVVREAFPALAIDKALARDMFRYGLKFYIACLLAYLLIRIDLLMVNYFLGTVEAGWYSVAISFTDLLYIFPAAVATVLFPRVSAGQYGDGALTLRVSRFTLVAYGSLCLLAGLLARPLVLLVYGEPFLPSVRPLVWLLPGIFMMGMLNIFAQDLAGRGYPILGVIMWVPPLLLNVILNFFWIPKFGILGAAWSSSLCYAILAACHLGYFLRLTKRRLRDALVPSLDEVRALANTLWLSRR